MMMKNKKKDKLSLCLWLVFGLSLVLALVGPLKTSVLVVVAVPDMDVATIVHDAPQSLSKSSRTVIKTPTQALADLRISVVGKAGGTPRSELPLNEPPRNELPQNEPPRIEPPQNEPPQNEPPRNKPLQIQQFQAHLSASKSTSVSASPVKHSSRSIKAIADDGNQTTTISVLLNDVPNSYEYSLFESGYLQYRRRLSFGSISEMTAKKKIQYHVQRFNFTKEASATASNETPTSTSSEWKQRAQHPCLLVTYPAGGIMKLRKTHAHQCRLLLIPDEWCERRKVDVRYYYNDRKMNLNLPSPTSSTPFWLPLGPRQDFWHAFVNINSSSSPTSTSIAVPLLPTTSQRKYVFNAIFSRNTSPSRKLLAEQLLLLQYNHSNLSLKDDVSTQHEQHQGAHSDTSKNNKSYYLHIAGAWTQVLGDEHLQPSQYAQVLQDSRFTLSPNGHNPHCFRLYEAIEAGSIPIIVLDTDEYKQHHCQHSLKPFLMSYGDDIDENGSNTSVFASASASPIVVLKSWDELEDRLEELLQDPIALDRRQEALQIWYQRFWRNRIQQFEAFLLRPR